MKCKKMSDFSFELKEFKKKADNNYHFFLFALFNVTQKIKTKKRTPLVTKLPYSANHLIELLPYG